jgi:hypothetical protein
MDTCRPVAVGDVRFGPDIIESSDCLATLRRANDMEGVPIRPFRRRRGPESRIGGRMLARDRDQTREEGMTESTKPLKRWRLGLHPHAAEMRIISLSRVHLQLGEALRIEMQAGDGTGGGDVHLQYYIATELGPWALWLTCPRTDLADCEAALKDLTPPFAAELAGAG